ncbi:Succinyl-CoA:coenzyme A transferase [Phycisphaerae bacterium RAS1]|nr:Succinyl-CoA:coenzyme A transferase [Phycisphaerae bacterium RAS1]
MAPDWRTRCQGKLTTLKRAISEIKRGEHLYLSDGSATPHGLIQGLMADDVQLGDNEIVHMLTLGPAPYVQPQYASRFRHNALFIGANVREAVTEGRADYTPVFLSEIPGLIRSGRIRVDVALVSLAPPDAEGYCSFGTHVDCAIAATSVARLVIGQINPRMPRTFGPGRIHVDRVHHLVEFEHPLPELPTPKIRPETETIARHVAELIPDGATLQMGIGGIPDQVLRFLRDRKDLGIHTEMFSDGVVDLVERGVVTCNRKNFNPGKIVAGFVLGSQKTYDWMHENKLVEMHPVDYTNDPFNIAQNDNMHAINTCLQVDLTGQVCSDSIGTSFYSGIGGQVDFIRGAARSKGGKAIIALPSTALDGVVSRIVPRLDEGAGVVTTRGDVHWIVTEYGAVNLHGMNVRERAMALITIAHPKFRPWLLAEAKRNKFIYSDQLEPPIYAPVYPKALEARTHTKDGLELFLRPVRPTDERQMHDLFYTLSSETVHQRFFAAKKYMWHDNLQRFCTIDYDRDMTLVATIRKGATEIIIAWASYNLDARTEFAEAAFVVADVYQNRGIGTILMRRLTAIAEARQIRGFTATVLVSNPRMLRVFEKCGYPIQREREGDIYLLSIPFEESTRELWEANATR